MAAGENPSAGTWTRRPIPELLHTGMFGGHPFKMATECRAKISVVPGRIGDEVSAPIIKNAPMRIGEAVRNVALKFTGARLEAVDGRVVIAHWRTPRSL